MRAGGCTVQQALTPEAASIVKQAVSLARRRGHAQVTPLHVANAMLSSSTGLLRAACLQSHSHPLQCKALELCFNVALNHSLESKRRRGVVVVGECLDTSEGVVRTVMDRVEKGGEMIPSDTLGLINIQFIILPLFTLGHMSREEVEHKVGELRCLVKSCYGGTRGAVLYLGDLKWAAEYSAGCGDKGRGFYCPVEHMIMEIGRLLCEGDQADGGALNFWLMGIATYQTYIKCRAGSPSLESLWALHPLTIPSGSLGLSLNYDNNSQISQLKTKRSGDASLWSLMDKGVGNNQLNCCTDCSVKYDTDNGGRKLSSSHGSVSTSLPSWLQQYKEEKRRETSLDHQNALQGKHSCKNWSSICSSSQKQYHHQHSEMTLHFSSASPSSSSISSHEHQPWPISSKLPWREHHIWLSESVNEGFESRSLNFGKERKGQMNHSVLPCGILKPNPMSTSSSDTMEMEYSHNFKELNAENLKTLCNALEKKVSWHKDIVPEIASTVLRCRSGMMRRKEKIKPMDTKEETWMFFQGGDCEAKEKIARELATLVFGSSNNLVTISLNNYSSTTKSDSSSDDLRNKRMRSEASHSYLERFFEAIRDNPHRVFLMEDLEQIDYRSQVGIKNAIERGRIRSSRGEETSVGDAIIILSCESFDSRSRACSPPVKQKSESEEEKEDAGDHHKEVGSGIFLDLNLCAEDEDAEDVVVDDVGLLDSVDRSFFFKLHEDL
ncbi:hypothetical protein J5N97_012120 [Dioscorea zingiberensis]|uniref:Clp R domain-containing protein n=1 Tax=Dioscorea zingiberensis TaxID=325984 RepID=A0A9D5CNJ9_9LILI|nr:hypothetical protein J5N97_012120 [Dioscorea zingiberensis]